MKMFFFIYRNMYNISQDSTTGTVVISDNYQFDVAPQFSAIGDTYVMSFINLERIDRFKTLDFNTYGSNESRYLKATYRISRDGNSWSQWFDIKETQLLTFPPFDNKDLMFIDIKWERIGTSTLGVIKLTDYTLSGNIARNVVDGESVINLNSNDKSVVIKPPYVYKVFKITDLEILSDGDMVSVDIKYRFSQDYGRTVSQWEPLTKENITTLKINPIRFFQIEYLVEYNGTGYAKIYDINLIGDFQNVTLDSQKSNVYGVRENCNCLKLGLLLDPTTNIANISNIQELSGMMTGQSCDPNVNKPMTADDISKLYQPYQQQQALNLLNKLSSDANQLFGHEVVYFLTDPDKKGIDFSFHEYQLYNYVCNDLIKVLVDQNNFPDNQIVMNQFDLSLFDSFEIHIPKDTFKSAFGPEKRPSKEDFLWFCEINRMFQVEHVQQFRSFNNYSLYYKIMLKKYVQKSNVIGANQTITDKLKQLTKNSTIDELFGLDNTLDKKDIANKEQTLTLTQDLLRQQINVDINRELIENSTTIISKSNYELSSVYPGTVAIEYRNFRKHFKVSDNIGYFMWFNINNYATNDVYNFVDYYDDADNIGFKINLESDNISLNLNSDVYNFNLGVDGIFENVWYCYVINIDQRQRKIQQWIYKRNTDDESMASYLGSTKLQKLHYQEVDLTPVEFELDNLDEVRIMGSDMKMTNIRMFNDVIPESEHTKLLNQIIIGEDYKYLIFADNANKRITLPRYNVSQVNDNKIRTEIDKEDLS